LEPDKLYTLTAFAIFSKDHNIIQRSILDENIKITKDSNPRKLAYNISIALAETQVQYNESGENNQVILQYRKWLSKDELATSSKKAIQILDGRLEDSIANKGFSFTVDGSLAKCPPTKINNEFKTLSPYDFLGPFFDGHFSLTCWINS
jgi:hypothetical protein